MTRLQFEALWTSFRHPAAITVADQVFSSASNALLTLMVAGASTAAQFGYFIAAFSAFTLLLVVSRTFLSVFVSLESGDRRAVERSAGGALTFTLCAAPVLFAIIMATSRLTGGPLTGTLVIFGVGACLAVAQDNLRFAAVANGDPKNALASDFVWALFMAIAVLGRYLLHISEEWVVALWSAGAGVALLMLMFSVSRPLHLATALQHLMPSIRGRMSLSTSTLLSAASVTISTILVTRIAGPDVSGALGAAGQLMAPTSVSVALLQLAVLPAAARHDLAWSRRAFVLSAALLCGLTLAWTAFLLVIPQGWGQALLGDTWIDARRVLPIVGLMTALVGAGAGALGLLLRRRRMSLIAGLRTTQALLRIGVATIMAVVFGTAVAVASGELVVVGTFVPIQWFPAVRGVEEES